MIELPRKATGNAILITLPSSMRKAMTFIFMNIYPNNLKVDSSHMREFQCNTFIIPKLSCSKYSRIVTKFVILKCALMKR